MSSGYRITHIGLCVREVTKATAFYCGALGFEKVGEMRVDDAASAQLLDVEGLVLDLVYLQRDGFRLELLGYTEPDTTGVAEPRPMNMLGFTHLSIRVDDVDALANRVVEHGGRLLADRTVVFGGGNRGLMLTDPDGNLLELIERPSRA